MKLSQIMNTGNMNTINRILDRYGRDSKEINKIIRDVCSALDSPNIFLYHIIGREMGYSEEINSRIKSYEAFYKVESKDLIDC